MASTQTMTLTFRDCQPDGTRYHERIDDQTWNLYRHRLEEMHVSRLPRATMLDILEHDYDFHPSLPQLNARMNKWGYIVYASKHRPTNRPQIQRPAESSQTSEEDPEQVIEHTGLIGSPISVPTLSREDSRESDFSPPSDGSEPGRSNPHTLAKEDDISLSDPRNENETDQERSSNSLCLVVPKAARLPEYCSQSCCEPSIRNHRSMIAAQFLGSLQCTTSASSILLPLVAEMGSDYSVASSDLVWAKLNCSRLSGSLSAPDQRTPNWNTQDWQCIPGPLRGYTLSSGSTSLPSSLTHLSMISQYRRTGHFTYYPPVDSAPSSWKLDLQLLYEEVINWEEASGILLRLLLWSLGSLQSSALRRELQQISVHLGHLKEHAKLNQITLPRIISCYFLSRWAAEPCAGILETLIKLKGSFGPYLSLEVMLPEVFVSFAHMVVAKGDHVHVTPGLFEEKSFVNRFAGKLYTSLEEICHSKPEEYCSDFSETLLSISSYSSTETAQQHCRYSEQLVEKLAYGIMGKGYIGKYGFEKAASNLHPNWMPLADCFRVHNVPINSHSPLTQQDTISPNSIVQLAGELKRSQGSISESCAPSRTIATSTSPAMCQVISTIVDNVVDVGQRSSPPGHQSQVYDSANTPLKRAIAVRVKRMDTNSSGMSLDSMRELSSRTQARQLAREIGVARNSSSSSGMTLGSQFSFTRVTGLGRGNSTASKFSFTPESMSVDAISPSMNERLSYTHSEDLLTEEHAALHRKVSEWITRDFSQKKRPDFNRRSTEPAFIMDASKSTAEFMLIQVQEH